MGLFSNSRVAVVASRDLLTVFVLILTVLEFSMLLFHGAPRPILGQRYSAQRKLLERTTREGALPGTFEEEGGGIEDLRESVVSLQKEMQALTQELKEHGGAEPAHLSSGNASLISWAEGAECQQRKLGLLEGHIVWEAEPNKYLIAGCHVGGFSNRLECLLQSLNLANGLKRTLVIAPWLSLEESAGGDNTMVDLDPAEVLDLNLANFCAGDERILSWAEFQAVNRDGLSVQGLCIYCPEEKQRCLQGMRLGAQLLEQDFASLDVMGYDVKDVQTEFSYAADILWVSEATHITTLWKYNPSVNCHLVNEILQPSATVRLAAKKYILSALGDEYAAIHLRRGDFLDYVKLTGDQSKFTRTNTDPHARYVTVPLPQVADCIKAGLRGSGIRILFIATNAPKTELEELNQMLAPAGIQTVKLPSFREWDQYRWAKGLIVNHQVQALLEKFICASATVFISSHGSIFSENIANMRWAWQMQGCHDHELCTNRSPLDD